MQSTRLRNWLRSYGRSGKKQNAALSVPRWLRRNPQHSLPIVLLALYFSVWLIALHPEPKKVPVPLSLPVVAATPAAPPETGKPETGERLNATRFVSEGRNQWRIEIWETGEGLSVEDYVKFYRNGHIVRQTNAETLGGMTLGFGKVKFATRFPVLVLQVEPGCGTPTVTQLYTFRGGKLINMAEVGALNGGPLFRDYDGDGKPEWVFDDYDWYTYYGKPPKHFLIYKEQANGKLKLWKRLPNKKGTRLPSNLDQEDWDT